MARRALAILYAKCMFSIVRTVFKSYCFPHQHLKVSELHILVEAGDGDGGEGDGDQLFKTVALGAPSVMLYQDHK